MLLTSLEPIFVVLQKKERKKGWSGEALFIETLHPSDNSDGLGSERVSIRGLRRDAAAGKVKETFKEEKKEEKKREHS